METSFCELRGKEVINIVDGKKLGRIIDLVFDDCTGKIFGIVVPSYNKSWNIFKQSDDIFIPFNCICKFGDDAILVRIFVQNTNVMSKKAKIQNIPQGTSENMTNKNNNVSNVDFQDYTIENLASDKMDEKNKSN